MTRHAQDFHPMLYGTQYRVLTRLGAEAHGFLQRRVLSMNLKVQRNAVTNALLIITGKGDLAFQIRGQTRHAVQNLQIQTGTQFRVLLRPGAAEFGVRQRQVPITKRQA